MQIISRQPFSTLFFHHWDLTGNEMGVLIVKGSYHIDEAQRCERFCTENSEIILTDLFHGEVNTSPIKQESDLTPLKPKTDITFNAYARSPDETPLENWPVSFTVKDKLSSSFHVFGERHWESKGNAKTKNWELSPIKAISELPLTYTFAYGGTINISEDKSSSHAYNPIGRGLLSDYALEQEMVVPAPQIGLLNELSCPEPNTNLTVCGCGPLTKSFSPRLELAGTFDDIWLRERHPLMPLDFKTSYWNGAPSALQASNYLIGDETIELVGIRHEPRTYSFVLPGLIVDCIVSRYNSVKTEKHTLILDTVHCDISSKAEEDHWVSLTWRLNLENPEDITKLELLTRYI